MQRHCTDLTEKLLRSLDEENNVVDMGSVVEVITALEKIQITKEVLEFTRLGKYINELRRKTSNESLAKRAKYLLRRWREMVLPATTPQPTVADTAPLVLNGTNTHNPALRNIKPQSPALRGLKPQSPLLKATPLSRVSSPSLSLHSDHSQSPVISPSKPPTPATNNHKLNSNNIQAEVKHLGQNHLSEAVPRTHSSNKRLRKDDSTFSEFEAASKKQRLNGETVSSSNENSQVPSPVPIEPLEFIAPPTEPLEFIAPPFNPESNTVKKRGRKKGSKSIKKTSIEDTVKEKLASFSRNPKLKTTKELLADLQARGSNSNANLLPSHNVNPPNIEDVLRTKIDKNTSQHLSKNHQNNLRHKKAQNSSAQKITCIQLDDSNSPKIYQESETADEDTRDSVVHPEKDFKVQENLTVEEILAKLPPIDRDSIDWTEDDDENQYMVDENEIKPKEITKVDLERLHSECVEGLNGNFEPKSSISSFSENSEFIKTCEDKLEQDSVTGLKKPSEKDKVFREWHEMLARPSFEENLLNILPYVIID